MRHPIVTPALGLVESITVAEWHREHGAKIEEGADVVTIETEKAQVDLQAPCAGRLEIVVPPGPELVPADAVLGYVDDENAE